jgi:hypothetical protein
MFKGNKGRAFITFVIVLSTIISVAVDWNESHIFNKEWHGHAVYHGLLFLNLLIGTSIVGIWLMWRASKEPELGVKLAVLLHCIYRVSFFYLGYIVNTANPMPNHDEVPHFAGMHMYPNVIASGIIAALLLLGYWIYKRENAGLSNIKF